MCCADVKVYEPNSGSYTVEGYCMNSAVVNQMEMTYVYDFEVYMSCNGKQEGMKDSAVRAFATIMSAAALMAYGF